MASGEGTVAEEVHDQRACPVEACPLEGLACQDAVLAGEDALLVDHTLVAAQGSRRVQLGLVGGPGQAQSLAGVEIPEGDDRQDQVLGPCQVVHAEVVGHVRGFAVVGVLDAAGQLG